MKNKQINLSSLSKDTQAAVKRELRLKQIKAAIDPYFLQTYEETKAWLDQAGIKNYTIDPNTLVVDARGSVYIGNTGLTKIPVQFGRVRENFDCYSNKLTSLKGAPQTVGGDFDCWNNKLTSLEGAPKEVGEKFYAKGNPALTTLDGIGNVGGKVYTDFTLKK